MNKLFGFFSTKTQTSDPYDLSGHPNAIKLRDAMGSDKAKQLIVELKQQTQQLTKKDIQKWRSAHQYAINIENPKRLELYNIYDDAMLDLHLKGAIRNRKLKVMGTPFKIVNKDGLENTDLTRLLKNSWFRKFMSLSMDSLFYGHSLIQFGDIIREGELRFKSVSLVPRRHVCPEFGVLLKEPADEPKKGISYTKPPYTNWSIGVGDPFDIGELNAVAKETISKKYVLQFWGQFAEIFGIPIRVAKTGSRDKKDQDKIEAMLEDMGSAPWGLFPEGTSLEIIETTRGDAYKVYDVRVQRANSEMSKAILGQTMTMDDGSSRSQAQVHEHVADDIAEYDSTQMLDINNDQLIPFLNIHGFGFGDNKFAWDDTYEFSPSEMKDIENMLLNNYDIDPQYFTKKYGIAITGKKQTQTQDLAPEKKKTTLIANPPEIILCCEHEFDNGLITLAGSNDEINKATDSLIRHVWDNRDFEYNWDYFKFISDLYIDALIRGYKDDNPIKLAYKSFGDIGIDYDSTDCATLQMMEANLFRFSSAKTLSDVNKLNALLPDCKTFNEFKKKAGKKIGKHLRAEYNLAYSTSRNAAEYHRLVKIKGDFPTWQYMTTGDADVRDGHRALHGKKFRADDPAFDSIYTPNGWGCRCWIKALRELLADKDYTSEKQAKELLQKSGVDKNGVSEWDRMVEGRFNKNRAKIKTIFDENKFYVKEELLEKLTYKSQGLPTYKDILKQNFTKKVIKGRTKDYAINWHKENADNIADYNKRKILFRTQTLKSHLKDSYIAKGADGRQNTIELIPDIITSPNEVYLFEEGRSRTIKMRYIKYYADYTMNVITEISDDGSVLNSWYKLDINKIDRDFRQGILIKNAFKH